MARKSMLAQSTAILLLVTAGCAAPSIDAGGTTTGGDYEETTTIPATETTYVAEGLLLANVVEESPENATVVQFSTSGVNNSIILREVLDRAITEGVGGAIELSPEERKSVERTLGDVPMYRGDEFGYYFRYKNETVNVRVVRYA